MKISNDTLDVLKNYATINSNILIHPGKLLRTIGPQSNIFAEAMVKEEFPVEIPLWDLNHFLSVVSLFDKPDFTFEEKCVVISSGAKKVRYFYAAKEVITFKDAEMVMDDPPIKFTLTQDVIGDIIKGSAVLQAPDLLIQSHDGSNLELALTDIENDTTNTLTFKVDNWTPTDVSFMMIMRVEELKLLAGDYEVSIAEELISEFKHTSRDVTYWIATNIKSKYGE